MDKKGALRERLVRVCTIPPGLPFLDTLAAGIWREAEADGLRLVRAQVLLPTRRACRALRDAFLRLTDGAPLLLPRIQPLGDVDEDELVLSGDEVASDDLDRSAIPELRRRLMLARTILARAKAAPDGEASRPEQAIDLATELARLIDQVQTERLSFDRLDKLVPDEFAEHWRHTLEFLKIVTENWPKILAEEDAVDPAARRDGALAALARHWREAPPADPIYAAGSTGSIPATADLLGVVARLPRGAVILPGLDRDLDAASWEVLDETHPQFGLARLLAHIGIDRAGVEDWAPAPPEKRARARLVSAALRPAATSESWDRDAVSDAALDGLVRIDCAQPQQEAGIIALLLREAIETAGRTAALITPDRGLARRVAAELARFDIAIDDSAGRPLADTPPGVFLRLVAELAEDSVPPATLLASLKHPLAAGGLPRAAFLTLVRRLEIAALRGPRPAPGFGGIAAALAASREGGGKDDLGAWLHNLARLVQPYAALLEMPAAPAELLRAHIGLAEALAATDDETGAARLWGGDDGEAAAGFVGELAEALDGFPKLSGAEYPTFFAKCMDGRVVRPRYGRHPRLAIFGPLEARLLQPDLVILGGMNEGTFPPEPPSDPWLSRPMRKAFGLPAPERRIGLAAHDFAQACGAPQVVFTRAVRVEGAPTVPSRWLLRLDNLLAAAGRADWLQQQRPELHAWQRQLDEVGDPPTPEAPQPRPPVSQRPRRLSVSEIEIWRRDPYSIYAKHILRLRALEPLDAEPGVAERGEIIHRALAEFVQCFRDELPRDALARLVAIGERHFVPILARPTLAAFWWPRFISIAAWFVAYERERRRFAQPIAVECRGSLTVSAPAGTFTLTARADRIDRHRDGGLEIIDYKTGAAPKTREVVLGYAPQLPLEAAIAEQGGFADVPAEAVAILSYWRLRGGEPAAEVSTPHEGRNGADAATLTAAALAGLKDMVARFDDPSTPYAARPRPEFAPRYSDYEHLARVKEWSAVEDDEW
ncbi:MAG: double-strand break repair protein AddB [Proteobacteria bacterium]|nr:double-strand break repair protein AddB [Pseudomonadota bacterium]